MYLCQISIIQELHYYFISLDFKFVLLYHKHHF